ncbi:MAG: nucleotidyltransferase family protein [Candidatus Latescibacteria bacterium]|nr:nucleotidyltransferase family protein [Candidatus Latescibacterota bacterium]
MKKRICALVPAAGMSTRMGSPKQLLPFGGKTVLQTVVDTLLDANLDGILVVLGHRADAVRESLAERPVLFHLNPDYRKGMFSSILCGLSVLGKSADAALIALGDQPNVRARVVRKVAAAYRKGDRGIVVPVCRGKRGHPALVDLGRYLSEIRSLTGEDGLKPVMRGHPDDTLEVEVEDDGVLRDIDTPEEYRAELDRLQP